MFQLSDPDRSNFYSLMPDSNVAVISAGQLWSRGPKIEISSLFYWGIFYNLNCSSVSVWLSLLSMLFITDAEVPIVLSDIYSKMSFGFLFKMEDMV